MVFGYNTLERAGRLPESKGFSSNNSSAVSKVWQSACLLRKFCDAAQKWWVYDTAGPKFIGLAPPEFFLALEGSILAF